jgi:hypothetical protein
VRFFYTGKRKQKKRSEGENKDVVLRGGRKGGGSFIRRVESRLWTVEN